MTRLRPLPEGYNKGDRDPTPKTQEKPRCSATGPEGYYCTWFESKHPPRHVAGTGAWVCESWPVAEA